MGSRLVFSGLVCFAGLACGPATTVRAGPGDTHFWLSASGELGANAAPPTMAPTIPKAPGSTGTLFLWAKLATVRNDNSLPQTDSLAAWSLRLVTEQTSLLSFTTSAVNNPVTGMPEGQPQFRWHTTNEPSGQSNQATTDPPAPPTNSIQDLQGFNLPFGAGVGTGIGPGTAGGSWLLGQINYSLTSTVGSASVFLQIGGIGANYVGQTSSFTSVVLGHATDAALNADSQRARNSLVVDATIAVSAGRPGDFDFDGDVDGADFLKWQRGQSPNPLSGGDLSLWRGNFGDPASGVRSPADFNDDDRVDGADFLVWQRGVGINGGATQGQGDANEDGMVNGADLGVWRNQFGDVEATAVAVNVPEPSGGVLILMAAGFWGGRRLGTRWVWRGLLPALAHAKLRSWLIVFCTAGLVANPVYAQTVATWNGPAGGSYGTATNWLPIGVPLNGGGNLYRVVIPTGKSVVYDTNGNGAISEFALESGSTFAINTLGRNLQVLGAATVAGRITTSGGSFVAGPGSSVVGQTTFFATDGGIVDLSAAIPSAYQGGFAGSQTIFQATGKNGSGVSSLLDLSNFQTLRTSDGQFGTGNFLTIQAANGGVVDFRNIISADHGALDGNDRLRFLIQGGAFGPGDIRFDKLASIADTRFDVEVPNYSLPMIANAVTSDFIVSANNVLTMNQLTTHSGGGGYNAANGALISAPNLQSLTSAYVSLTGSASLATGGLANIDHSRFYMSNGASFGEAITATTYLGSFAGSQTIFQATGKSGSGVSSLLDLSNLQTLQTRDGQFGTGSSQDIHAANGGVVDLSNLVSAANVGDDGGDRLRFLIQGGAFGPGDIRLDKLASITNTRFDVEVPNYSLPMLTSAISSSFFASAGASVSLPRLQNIGSVGLSVSGLQSVIEIGGSVNFDGSHQVTVNNGGGLRIGGNFSFLHNSESQLALSSGTLVLNGEGQQQLEAGGQDVGITGSSSTNNGNFGIGQLIIGSATQKSTVRLVDSVNNGNRNGPVGANEALYLFGLGGQSGLQLLNDSTLSLDGLNVYAWDSAANAPSHLNSLFAPGVLTLPYGGGFLQLQGGIGPFAWNATGSSNWYQGTNWSPQFIPDGDFKAIFGNAASGPATVTLDRDIRISEMQFNNGTHSYTVAGDGTHGLELTGAAAIEVTAGSHTISAPIAGVNGLAKSGPGTLRLSGANSYTGPTHIQAGTLRADAAANLGDTDLITVDSGATLDVSDASVYQLQANQTLTGRGTVRADLLTLSPTSELRGTLQIQGDVASAGRVAPGFSPGITTILGNYSQQPDGVLEMEVGGRATGTEHDLLIVTGTASLAGRLEIPIIDGYIPQPGHDMQLILAGSVVGEFDSHSISPDLATINSSVAHEVVTTPGGVRLRFLAPSTDNLFDPDAPTANWAETANWTTGEVPTTVDVITLENDSGQTQRLDVQFLPMLADSKNAFTHELTLMGSGETMAVSVQQGSSLSATVGVNVAQDGLIELAGGTVVTSTLDVQDGGMVAGGGTVVGNYQQDAGGELVLQIDGLNDFDAIDISREADLGGTLTVNLNDLSIGAGEEFVVISAGSLAPGSKFDRVVTVSDGDIRLRPVYDESDPDQTNVVLLSYEHTPGDMNGDGVLTVDDAIRMALALKNPAEFLATSTVGMTAEQAGNCHPVGIKDSDFDFDDVITISQNLPPGVSQAQFAEMLSAALAVPEPGAATLALLGFVVIGGSRRRRLAVDFPFSKVEEPPEAGGQAHFAPSTPQNEPVPGGSRGRNWES